MSKITIDNETYNISDELANEIRERARAESGEFRYDDDVFILYEGGKITEDTYRDDVYSGMAERGRVSRSREYLERYDARELARERLRRAYLKVVGDWRWEEGETYYIPCRIDDIWFGNSFEMVIPFEYKFITRTQAQQFGTDNDADLRTVMEADDER